MGLQLSAADQESLLSIQVAMTSLAAFIDLAQTYMSLEIQTAIIWGFFGLVFEVSCIEKLWKR